MECRMKDVLSFCKARDKAIEEFKSTHGQAKLLNGSLAEELKVNIQIALLKYGKEWLELYEEQTLGKFLEEFLRYFGIDEASDLVAYTGINRIHIWRNMLAHAGRFIGVGYFQYTPAPPSQKKIGKFLESGELWGDGLVNSCTLMLVMRDVVILDTIVMPALADKFSIPYTPVEGTEELENLFPFWKDIIGWSGLQEQIERKLEWDNIKFMQNEVDPPVTTA